jgi:predicted ester cyclase
VVVHAPLGLASRGIEAEREVWRSVLYAFPDLRHEIKELVSMGTTLAARVVVTGTQKWEFSGIPSKGRRFEIDQATFVHVQDGKAIEVWEVADTASLLRQLAGYDVGP